MDYLHRNGLTIRAAGYFDFDGDGINEKWFSAQPQPAGKLEFWILTTTSTGVQAVFVQIYEDNSPQPYLHDPTETPQVVQLEIGRGMILERDPSTGEVALSFVDVEYSRPTFIRDNLELAIQALLSGTDPEVVLADLREIRISPRFAGDCNAFGICARFYYTLGLAYELTGDQLNATGSYLTVWRTYPFSPYTLMARLKAGIDSGHTHYDPNDQPDTNHQPDTNDHLDSRSQPDLYANSLGIPSARHAHPSALSMIPDSTIIFQPAQWRLVVTPPAPGGVEYGC